MRMKISMFKYTFFAVQVLVSLAFVNTAQANLGLKEYINSTLSTKVANVTLKGDGSIKISVTMSEAEPVVGESPMDKGMAFIHAHSEIFGDLGSADIQVSSMKSRSDGAASLVFERRLSGIILNHWRVVIRLNPVGSVTYFSANIYEPNAEQINAAGSVGQISLNDVEEIVKADLASRLDVSSSAYQAAIDNLLFKKKIIKSAPYVIWDGGSSYLYKIDAITGDIISSHQNIMH